MFDLSPRCVTMKLSAGGLETAYEAVDLVLGVVMDEADPHGRVLVAETAVEPERVPRVVRPDADLALGQRARYLGRRHALDVDEERRHAAFHPRQSVHRDGVRDRIQEALPERA